MEERRKAPPESPAWQAISQLRLLSDSATAPFQRILKQAVQRCGGTGGVFALVRDPGIQLRAAVGAELLGSLPDSIFGLARGREQPLILDDAAADPVARDCPEVSDEPRIRMFASAPVRAPGGAVVGLLSVFSPFPRSQLPEAKPELLASFAHVLDLYLQMRANEEHDPDTGMLGPSAFLQVLIDEWNSARETGEEVNLLVFSLPTLGRINARRGAAAGDRVVAALAALINRKLLMNRQIFGRITGNSVGIIMPEHSSQDLLQSTVESVRNSLRLNDNARVPSAAAAFRLLPAQHPDVDPVLVLHGAERATAMRKACRLSHFPTFEIKHLRELYVPQAPAQDDGEAAASAQNEGDVAASDDTPEAAD